MSALAALRDAYRNRLAAADEWRRAGGSVVGYVGLDVPRELIEGAGHFALRLAPLDGVDSREADRILGPGVDEAMRLVLAGLLERAYPIDRLVLCHDSDHTVRLYTALRRLDPGVEPWFLDLLHEPRPSTEAHGRARLEELAAWLGGAGKLAEAVATANRARTLGARLSKLRRAGAVSGADGLALLGAWTALRSESYVDLLQAALSELGSAEGPTRTVLLLGSDHPSNEVYASIDELGACVVAETHGFGETLLAGRVDEEGDPLDALVRHYRPRPRVLPAPADVQLAWLRRGDETWAWSLPSEQRRLGREVRLLRDRPYRLAESSRDELRSALA